MNLENNNDDFIEVLSVFMVYFTLYARVGLTSSLTKMTIVFLLGSL